MIMKTSYATALYLLITGLTSVSAESHNIQSSFFGGNCIVPHGSATATL